MTDVDETPHTSSLGMKRGNDPGMRTDELDFDLPADLIAQTPSENRSDSRLLHYVRAGGAMHHRVFSDLADLLRPSDLLVFNDSKVIPARFALRKTTGGRIEGLFLSEPAPGQWLALLRDLGPAKKGTSLIFDADPGIRATILDESRPGRIPAAKFPTNLPRRICSTLGRMPLPPYIKRDKRSRRARRAGSRGVIRRSTPIPRRRRRPDGRIAFHDRASGPARRKGIERVMVTLHVGIGTFKPITAETLDDHEMHGETLFDRSRRRRVAQSGEAGNRRIVAIGTTSARVLESQPADRPFAAGSGSTSIFIYPPYRWKHVGALVTNFHLPRSTLIAMVAAMTGLEEQRRIYQEAIGERYRFFSYGDAMFID